MDPEAFNRGIWMYLAALAVGVVVLGIALLIAMAKTPKQHEDARVEKRHGFDVVKSDADARKADDEQQSL